jgi:hypothetical protein
MTFPFTMGDVPPPPDTVTVPNVIGQQQTAATAALTAAQLVVGSVTTQADPAPSGIVLTQTPVAGTVVPKGSTVALVVSSGPAPPVETWQAATAEVSSLGRARLKRPDGTFVELQVKP